MTASCRRHDRKVMDTGAVVRSHAMQETGLRNYAREKQLSMLLKGVTKEKNIQT